MNLIRLIKPCTWYHRVFHRLYPMPFLWSVSSHFVVGLEGVHKMTTAFLAVIYQSSVVDTFLALTYPPPMSNLDTRRRSSFFTSLSFQFKWSILLTGAVKQAITTLNHAVEHNRVGTALAQTVILIFHISDSLWLDYSERPNALIHFSKIAWHSSMS